MGGIFKIALEKRKKREQVFEGEKMGIFNSMFKTGEPTTRVVEEMEQVEEAVLEEKEKSNERKAKEPEEKEREAAAFTRELGS